VGGVADAEEAGGVPVLEVVDLDGEELDLVPGGELADAIGEEGCEVGEGGAEGFEAGGPEEGVEEVELVHDLEGGGVDGVAAEVAVEVFVFLEDGDGFEGWWAWVGLGCV
jgi:hypothetical protein